MYGRYSLLYYKRGSGKILIEETEMKRIVAALIVVIMCFMLSACSFPTYKTPLM